MTKYWKVTFEGELSEDEVQIAIGDGLLARIDRGTGRTRVFFGADKEPAAERATEVSLEDVLKLS